MDLNYLIREAARTKELDVELIIHALEDAMAAAARRYKRIKGKVVGRHDPQQNCIRIFLEKRVVRKVTNPDEEISLKEAQKDNPGIQIGDVWTKELDTTDLGRIAAQTAKQVLFQRLRDAERTKISEEYSQKIGELVTGTVKRFERGEIVVDLGKTEGKIPKVHQTRTERWEIGERIRAIVVDVLEKTAGPQVILSRTDPRLLIRLLEIEVPEIYDGTVIIKNAVREPGLRAKVAVYSRDRDVDPLGACVGMKGNRVQAVTRELRGEKIDIIPYAEDLVTYAQNALQPAKINRVMVKTNEQGVKELEVVVDDEQLSLAIGKKGQNVRLASDLIGVKIEIKSEQQVKDEVAQALSRMLEASQQAGKGSPLTELPGIGPKMAEKLQQAGYQSIEDIQKASVEDLTKIPGISEKMAAKLIGAAHEGRKG